MERRQEGTMQHVYRNYSGVRNGALYVYLFLRTKCHRDLPGVVVEPGGEPAETVSRQDQYTPGCAQAPGDRLPGGDRNKDND